MKLRRNLAAFIAFCVIGLAPVLASGDSADPQQMGMEQLTARLHLTTDQQAKIQPLLEARRARLEAAHSKMGSNSSRRDKRAAMKEARAAQEDFVRNVAPLLTAEQQEEWEKMRSEAREQMKERWHSRGQQ